MVTIIYRNYIFDLYGTLVDIHTNEKKALVWKKMALCMTLSGAVYMPAELRCAYRRLVAEYLHRQTAVQSERWGALLTEQEVDIQLADVWKALFAEKGVTASDRQIQDAGLFFRALSTERLQLFEQTRPLLLALKENGKRIYLLSNAQRLFTEPEMRGLGIYELFDGICYSSDAGLAKPSPFFYRYLLEQYSINKEESVMVGNDWQADAWGASRCGIPSFYIETEQSTPVTGAMPKDCVLISQLMDIL